MQQLGFSIILFPIDQPCLKKGGTGILVPLFKGDLGGFLGFLLPSRLVYTR
jgi:hypothetical protein